MELRQLEYVVAVVDEGGFTWAAERLFVSQPSLSQGIRTLERELGHGAVRPVGATGAPDGGGGGACWSRPGRSSRDAATARSAVAAVRGLVAGRLDVVALPTLAVEPLAGLIGAFRVAHPGVMVRVAEPEDTDSLVDLIRTGRCEIGLSELPAPELGLVFEPLVTQEVLVVLPPGTDPGPSRPFPVAALAGMPLITTGPGTSTRRLVDRALEAAGIEGNVAVETAQREALVPLVLAGAGTTFLPGPLADEAARRGAVVRSLDPPLRRTIGLLYRRGSLSPAAAEFRRITGERFAG